MVWNKLTRPSLRRALNPKGYGHLIEDVDIPQKPPKNASVRYGGGAPPIETVTAVVKPESGRPLSRNLQRRHSQSEFTATASTCPTVSTRSSLSAVSRRRVSHDTMAAIEAGIAMARSDNGELGESDSAGSSTEMKFERYRRHSLDSDGRTQGKIKRTRQNNENSTFNPYLFVNRRRAADGIPRIKRSAILEKFARKAAERMATSNSVHKSDMDEVADGIEECVGADGKHMVVELLGENVGYGVTVADVHHKFTKGAAELENMMEKNFTEIGIGVAISGCASNDSGKRRVFVCQLLKG